MMKAQKLLAENDRLTPESRCPKCNTKNLRYVRTTIEKGNVKITPTRNQKEGNNLSCQKCDFWVNYAEPNQKVTGVKCPQCKGKDLTPSTVTFKDRSKAILQSCPDCGWLEGEDNGFRNVKIFKEEDPLSPENRVRVNRLTADFDIHFGKHFVGGKLIKYDRACSFCEAYQK